MIDMPCTRTEEGWLLGPLVKMLSVIAKAFNSVNYRLYAQGVPLCLLGQLMSTMYLGTP